MNKGELVAALAAKANLKTTQSKALVETLTEIVKTALLAGDEVTLPGIGKLKVKTRPGRAGRNPSTGASIAIPAKRVAKFSPASDFEAEFSAVPAAPAVATA